MNNTQNIFKTTPQGGPLSVIDGVIPRKNKWWISLGWNNPTYRSYFTPFITGGLTLYLKKNPAPTPTAKSRCISVIFHQRFWCVFVLSRSQLSTTGDWFSLLELQKVRVFVLTKKTSFKFGWWRARAKKNHGTPYFFLVQKTTGKMPHSWYFVNEGIDSNSNLDVFLWWLERVPKIICKVEI